jgi:high-affinity Fe2+/Pb2+ permease
MSKPEKRKNTPIPEDPPRLTVAQAIVIGLLLVMGFIALENGLSLVFLLLTMLTAAFILNRLFQVILWWATRQERQAQSTANTNPLSDTQETP